ncbi:unnamed protein product [Spodoptera exigua]|uniref:Proteasome assembly chaperone 4 n=1 Tax=Spodoptera exigua TaxID=7107 RepID=A0A835GNR1_SPOEX|nr:hypothetical protein HW555_003317 [Spodoptera exigua]KAH9640945.1 hypothetical protein HF086_003035 [Spodoptera exigua]CAH0700259.1 unnamed protein product [Spodoptera exigua]
MELSKSKKRITYKPSGWRIHEFEIWSGDLICKAAALRVEGSLLLWLGGSGEAQLHEIALGMPSLQTQADTAKAALVTTLLGEDGAAAALARRLSAALGRPVYVCSGLVLDRFNMPLVERGLITEIKSRPECF